MQRLLFFELGAFASSKTQPPSSDLSLLFFNRSPAQQATAVGLHAPFFVLQHHEVI